MSLPPYSARERVTITTKATNGPPRRRGQPRPLVAGADESRRRATSQELAGLVGTILKHSVICCSPMTNCLPSLFSLPAHRSLRNLSSSSGSCVATLDVSLDPYQPPSLSIALICSPSPMRSTLQSCSRSAAGLPGLVLFHGATSGIVPDQD
jgi:hypothetical protein